ncbi:hypothetical protein [Leptospira weilii]|uniref:hypothetical protein n=1 Tax=Leptospira weilii TaxID=28184 RepID=UPI000302B598|nr:hypothetical protein [Leptospira weilii]
MVVSDARTGIKLKAKFGKNFHSFIGVHLKTGRSPKDKELRSEQLRTLNEI